MCFQWQAAVDCSSATERQQLCEQVFQGGEEEFGLMEALKLLMLSRAVELHASMQAGGDVPLFCWLLFARDSSDCPRSFLSNHLSHVGLSAGLEQVQNTKSFLYRKNVFITARRPQVNLNRHFRTESTECFTDFPDKQEAFYGKQHKESFFYFKIQPSPHLELTVTLGNETQKHLSFTFRLLRETCCGLFFLPVFSADMSMHHQPKG